MARANKRRRNACTEQQQQQQQQQQQEQLQPKPQPGREIEEYPKDFHKVLQFDVFSEILKRLNCPDIYNIAVVDKDCQALLSKEYIKSVCTQTPYHTSPHFLVHLRHTEPSGERDSALLMIVDEQGNCQKLDMDMHNALQNKYGGQPELWSILGVTYNGLIAVYCLPGIGRDPVFHILNHQSKRVREIVWPATLPFNRIHFKQDMSYGVWYDASSTSPLCMIIILWQLPMKRGVVHTYTAGAWSPPMTLHVPNKEHVLKHCFFSWGNIFGLNRAGRSFDASMVCLHMETMQLEVIALPACPFDGEGRCRCIVEWELIGWQDNMYVALTHHGKDERHFWRLVQQSDGGSGGYEWLHANSRSGIGGSFNVNMSQSWLFSGDKIRINRKVTLRLFNKDGTHNKTILQKDLLTLFDIKKIRLCAQNIWPFELGKLRWPRA